MSSAILRDERNPVLAFADAAFKTTHKGLEAATKIVEGADVTSKATKFIRAIITVANAVFSSIAAGWNDLASRLGEFATITDFVMIIASIKDLFDIAAGKITGWMKQAAHTCLAAFRILSTIQFLDKLKLISLGSLLNKVGCVPVLGTITSAFVVTALTFFAIETGKKLVDPKEKIKAADAKLASAEWDLIQAHYIKNAFGDTESKENDEKEAKSGGERTPPRSFFDKIILATHAVGEKLAPIGSGGRDGAMQTTNYLYGVAAKAKIQSKDFINLAVNLNALSKKPGTFNEKLTATKPVLEKISSLFLQLHAGYVDLAKQNELNDEHGVPCSVEQAPFLLGRTITNLTKPKGASPEASEVTQPANIQMLLSAGAIAKASQTIKKVHEIYKQAFADRLALEPNNVRVEERAKAIKDQRARFEGIGKDLADLPHSKGGQLDPKVAARLEFAEYRRKEILSEDLVSSNAEEAITEFHGINRFAVLAKESSDMKVIERKSSWIDLSDKVVKIALIILITVGVFGVAFFAMTGPLMIGLAAFSATLSLAKVAYDKLFKIELKLKEPSKIEQMYKNPYLMRDLGFYNSDLVGKLVAPRP